MSRRGRWYGGLAHHDGPTGRVQIETRVRDAAWPRGDKNAPLMLPEHVLRLAQREYDERFPGQPYERMQERGGLGILEVVALLADYVERLGGEPSPPRVQETEGT